MQALSDAMREALSGSHTVATKVEVLDVNGDTLTTIYDAVDGSVTVERAGVERRAEVKFVDVDGVLSPTEATSWLVPYGNALRVWRGVRYPDGSTEMVPLITGRIARSGGIYPHVSARLYDFAWVVTRARVEYPYVIASGTNVVTAVRDLLTNRLPGVVTNFPTSTRSTPLVVLEEAGDPWAQAQKLAESIGRRLYFDGLGVAAMATESTASDVGVWDYQEGPDALIVELDRDLDSEQHYNAVIVTGETPENDVPVRAVAYDSDPLSPTRWGSSYGKVPMFYASELITTTAQAQATADAMLLKELGMTEQLQISGLCNPAHEVGDALNVRRAASGVDSVHLLDNVTIPLKGATSSITTRARQVIGTV